MDERLVALGLARPAESPAAAQPAPLKPVPVAAAVATAEPDPADLRLIALGLARPANPAVAAPTPPPARTVTPPPLKPVTPRPVQQVPPPARSAAPAAARTVAPPPARVVSPPPVRSAPSMAPLVAPRAAVAARVVLFRQNVRLRDGRRDRDAVCEVDTSGIRISGIDDARFIPWPDLRSISVANGRLDIVSPTGSVNMAVALDSVSEPALAPLFARVLEEGRGGALDPTGSMHELTLGIDRTVEGFADADDPIVPAVVGAFAVAAGIMLGAAIPMIVVLGAHVQGVPLGTFAILPRVASFDPRVIVAAFGSAIALAAVVGRLALGASADAWARGTLRGWHRTAQRFEAAARRIGAWLMLRPGQAALVAGVAFLSLVPAVFARTTLDPQGIHESPGLPLIMQERSWLQLADVTSVPVGQGERPEGFEVKLVFADGSIVSTRGRDVIGGNQRALYDFARAQAR